jgi:hypothetical protein
MKTHYLSFLLLLFNVLSFAQVIELRKSGVSALRLTDNRAVGEIHDEIIRWAESTFRNGYDLQDRGSMIIIETVRRNALSYSNLGETYSYHATVRYSFILSDKDKRLQISIINFLDGTEPSSLKLESLFRNEETPKSDMSDAVSKLKLNLQKTIDKLQVRW